MSELEKNCTLLVNTCDSYSDSWDGFFKLLRIQWANIKMPIVLNTETMSYSFEPLNIKVLNAVDGEGEKVWGKRILDVLKRIETRYVLFVLEDFYLESPVRVKVVEECYRYMEENPNIACFSFYPVLDENNISSSRYTGFEKRPQKGEYKLNCQIALWNKDILAKCIRKHENPWEWELWGSRRSSRYKYEFYTLKQDETPVFDYCRGKIIMRGRWWKKYSDPLNTKYNLSLDYTKRESYEEYLENKPKRQRNLMRGIKNRISKIKSLI